MSDEMQRKGACLCGAVRITATTENNSVGACHCKMCRRWGGGPFMELTCTSDVAIDGKEHITVFDSSAWAERGFCNQCGTHLFYRLKKTGQHMIPVGFFDDDDEVVFDHQVFIDEKPSFYRFANETRNMTGVELFARYGSSG
ncbi:MAG: GFA family protein [Gammaproteobacteria bacterium]|nr:GFA family protein [Gammaproteobacteria bacterium]MDH3433504.1 GFA family protein [Gammaproteobacteria bacterium]